MGLLFEEAGLGGVAVVAVVGVICAVVWHGFATFAVAVLLVVLDGLGCKPVIRLRIVLMASNSVCSVGGLPLIVSSRFLITFVIRSVAVMVGVGRVWWLKVNVSVSRTAPESVTALMHR